MSIKRDIEKRKTPSGEIEVGVWRKLRADHLAHALGYWFVAIDSTAKAPVQDQHIQITILLVYMLYLYML